MRREKEDLVEVGADIRMGHHKTEEIVGEKLLW
jgi:hypothetical protein